MRVLPLLLGTSLSLIVACGGTAAGTGDGGKVDVEHPAKAWCQVKVGQCTPTAAVTPDKFTACETTAKCKSDAAPACDAAFAKYLLCAATTTQQLTCPSGAPSTSCVDEKAEYDSCVGDSASACEPHYPAAFPDPPSVVTYGGPVLEHPRFVPVFFSNDNANVVSQLTTFLNSVGTTDYWHQVTSEYCYWATMDHTVPPQYCIGDGTATASVTVDASELNGMKGTDGTLSDDSIKAWLTTKLQNNDPAFPAPDTGTIYVLHFPANIVISLPGGFTGGTSQSCQEFGGYHSDLNLANRLNGKVAYAVIPRCASFGSLLGIDAVTGAESHELIEASSDPYPSLSGGYYAGYAGVDSGHEYLSFLLGGTENGDMCAQDPQAFTQFDEIPFVVQRSWSNVAAKAGHDPCVPALPGQVYFSAGPVLNDVVSFSYQGYRASFVGVKVAVGKTVVVPIQLYSDADTGGPWQVSVTDGSMFLGGRSDLTLSLDKTSGVNGDVINLSITPKRTSQYGFYLFRVRSTMNGVSHDWWGSVGN